MGMHGVVACEECHIDSGYKKIKKSCVACHKNDDFMRVNWEITAIGATLLMTGVYGSLIIINNQNLN